MFWIVGIALGLPAAVFAMLEIVFLLTGRRPHVGLFGM